MANGNNGGGTKKPWGEIGVTEFVPPINTGPWWELYEELLLRLEQTPRGVLFVALPDNKEAMAAATSLKRSFKVHGDDFVVVAVRENRVFVQRGPNYISTK